jgi:hypothetical protein
MAGPSKLLDKKWKKEQAQLHRRKIRGVKSTIRDTFQSAPFGQQVHTGIRNGKKEAILERK